MEEKAINCFAHEIAFTLEQEESVLDWLLLLLGHYQQTAEGINYVFCSDEHLLEMNKQHLEHDYLTDILTFPYSPPGAPVFADIYISIDRVRDNAGVFKVGFEDELHRVMTHGMLHLLGYDDASPEEKDEMRRLETEALAMRSF